MLSRRRAAPPVAAAATAVAEAPGRHDSREEFLLALLLQYPGLRADGLDVGVDLLWESENRQVLAVWKSLEGREQSEEGIEAVKEGLPEELAPHVERLINRPLPFVDPKEAREALLDCRERLLDRQLRAEKQAVSALLAAREEELGPSALVAATAGPSEDERMQEAGSLHIRDMEAGLRLHRREQDDNSVQDQTTGRNDG